MIYDYLYKILFNKRIMIHIHGNSRYCEHRLPSRSGPHEALRPGRPDIPGASSGGARKRPCRSRRPGPADARRASEAPDALGGRSIPTTPRPSGPRAELGRARREVLAGLPAGPWPERRPRGASARQAGEEPDDAPHELADFEDRVRIAGAMTLGVAAMVRRPIRLRAGNSAARPRQPARRWRCQPDP